MNDNISHAIANLSEQQLNTYNWLVGELTQVAKKAPLPVDVQGMALDIMRDGRIKGSKEQLAQTLHELVGEKSKLMLSHVTPDGTFSLAAARQAKEAMQIGANDVVTKLKEVRSKPSAKVTNPISMETGVYTGLTLLAGAMGLMGAISCFGSAVQKDEDGNNKVQWSQVAFGVLNAAFAAGSAYIAHDGLKKAGVIR